jgi:BirA family biotin operon repressor/biotin-[acetyl-CoA-carboxylase] ligase
VSAAPPGDRGEPAARLRALLERTGRAWPGPIEHLGLADSTNDRLKDRARQGAATGAVVFADAQTAGRGRHGRAWISPSGGLYLSVLLRPPVASLPLLPLAAGLAVADGLAAFGVAARLKWPNDVVGAQGKVAGILAESSSSAGSLDWVVVGLGVNVDPRDELPEGASSMKRETGKAPPLLEVAAAVLGALPAWYDAVLASGNPSVVAAWRRRSVPWWGRTVEVRSGEQVLRGVLRDVDAQGALVIEPRDGPEVAVVSGDVRALRLEDA